MKYLFLTTTLESCPPCKSLLLFLKSLGDLNFSFVLRRTLRTGEASWDHNDIDDADNFLHLLSSVRSFPTSFLLKKVDGHWELLKTWAGFDKEIIDVLTNLQQTKPTFHAN